MVDITGEISVGDGARALRISERRVRAMVRVGILHGRRVGGRWLIRGADVARRARGHSRPGRPMSERNVWAMLRRLSAEEWPPLAAWDRSRLRRRLGRRSVLSLADELRRRAEVAHFRADPRVVDRIALDPDVIRSGVSAASEYGVDVRAPGVVEGYVSRDRVKDLVYRYALHPSDSATANVILRAVGANVLPRAQRVAPAAAVALDLLESADPRSRRAGRELARRLR